MSRADARKEYNAETRMSLLEADLDSMDQRLLETNERLAKILWALVGLLISVTTAAVVLALNLVVKS